MRRLGIVGGIFAGVSALSMGAAVAATTIVVTPTNQQGWSTGATTAGGTVSFVVDGSAPSGVGALKLTTDATSSAKAQYVHGTDTPLADVTDLSYWTKQNTASFVGGDPSYQLVVCLGGFSASPTPTCTGFTTLVYEPYQNGVVTPGAWQQWDVDAGLFWSTRSYSSGTCTVAGSPGGPSIHTLAVLKATCPDADVVQFGVNIGSNNPSYDVETDLVQFNDTTYDFEPYVVASSKDQCKNGGWVDVKRADGSSFNNQGDCIQYLNNGN